MPEPVLGSSASLWPWFLQNRFVYNGTLKDSHSYQNARFGSCIASVQDLNQDSFNDVVVGAPLEDSHRGAIYIFHGFQTSILKKPMQVGLSGDWVEQKAEPMYSCGSVSFHALLQEGSCLSVLLHVEILLWVHCMSRTSLSCPHTHLYLFHISPDEIPGTKHLYPDRNHQDWTAPT